jgi:hypothetical protein
MMKKFFVPLIVAALSLSAVLYGQRVIDTVQADAFHPSARVQAVNQRLELTSRGTDLLYASHATIEDQEQFNTSCQSSERTAAILGCYYQRNIYLFNITNSELDGAIEVTAAHEMLHAAYERLNFIERAHVDSLIKAEYQHLMKDPAIAEEMAYYQKAEPGAEINELHSIIGTTVADISPELESYYGQYFQKRSDIVALNEKYNAVFVALNKKAEALQASITAEQPAIKAALEAYNADRQQLETDIDTFNQRAASNGFSSQSSFNVTRNALMARVGEMNARRSAINQRVDNFNAMITELNQLSVRVNEINQSLNGAQPTSGV